MAIVEIRSGPKCQAGSTVLARVADLSSCEWWQTIGGDRGGCDLVLPADSAAVAKCAIMNVIRITDDDGSVYEYLIDGPLEDGPDVETVKVHAADPSYRMGMVRLSLVVGGVEQFHFTPGPLTPSQYIDTYVLPALAAAGMTWIVKGTITPTSTYTITQDRSTPLALIAALESATKYEFWLAFNADTNYQIMLGRRTAAGSPVAWVGRNVETLRRRISADARFYNRAIPCGATISGETETTHIGQHGWKLSAVGGDNLTLAHPQAGGVGPVGADGQFNGLVAGTSFDGIGFHNGAQGYGINGLAYDPSRKRVVTCMRDASGNTTRVVWRKLDDGTFGEVSIAGSTDQTDVVYDSGRDEFLVCCYDAQKIERITASTMVSAGNVATAAVNPQILSNLNERGGINKLAVGYAANTNCDLYNLATLALDASLAHAAARVSCWYDVNTTQYFIYTDGDAGVRCYSATYVFVRTITPFGAAGVVSAGGDGAGTLWVAKSAAGNLRAITCSTGALGTDTALAAYDGGAVTCSGGQRAARWMPYLGSRLYYAAQTASGYYLLAVDPASAFAISGGTRTPKPGGGNGTPSFVLFTYDATHDVFLFAARTGQAVILWRNGLTVPSGRLRMAIQGTVLSTQVIVKPTATKGPLVTSLPIEIRADAADTYLRQLTDPVSLAVYGPVDGYPIFTDAYKRNYKRDPQMLEWASGRPMWVGMQYPLLTNLSSFGDPKWVAADAQPAARSTTGQVDTNHTPASPIGNLKLRGLAAGRVLQVGDLIVVSGGSYPFIVATRAVVGSDITLSSDRVVVSCWTTQASALTDGWTATIYSPAATDGVGANMLALHAYGAGGGAAAMVAPSFATAVHVPRISGATQAWVRLALAVLQAGGNTNLITVKVSGFGNDTTLAGPNLVQGGFAAPIYVDVLLEQQLSLTANAGGDDFLTIEGTLGGFASYNQFLSVWVKSIEVYVATSAACPTPLGRKPGDELVPWIGGNDLLFNQGRSAPTVDYQVQFIEDGGTVVKVGQTVTLRDPARGVAALPRVVQVRRKIRRDGAEVARPIVQLSNRKLSAMESLVGAGN